MTTGEPIVARVAMKPLPTLTKPLRSVDIETKEPAEALRERTDSCTVPAAGVVGEAMLALELARAGREKFGGDAMEDVLAAVTRTASGSDGGGSESRHAAGHGPGARPKLVVVGFMGPASRPSRRLAAHCSAGRWPTPTP